MAWPMQSDLHHDLVTRQCVHRSPRAGLRRPLKTFIEWIIHNFPLPRCGSDRFRTVSRHRLCFEPAIMDMVIFLRSGSHGDTVARHNHVSSSTHAALAYRLAYPAPPSRKTPFSTALRCLTAQDKAQDTRILQHAGSLQVTSSCSCNGTHLTDAAESRPFLALRYESRPSLPLLDRYDEGCAAQG
jgi:hypothetical protein